MPAPPSVEALPPMPSVQGGPHHLSGAVAGGGQGGRSPAGEPAQPRHVGQLDHGNAVAFGVGSVDRLAGRPLGAHRDAAVAGRQGRIQGAVAAVGDRHLGDLDAGCRAG
jgi:hypothetical protein